MSNIREQILQRMRTVWPNMDEAEKAMTTLLVHQPMPITQDQIARKLSVGPHPVFETFYERPYDTTMRRVRQIIHDLKVRHGIVIVSSQKGYWIPSTIEEVETYLDTFERQARSAAKSYMVTYNTMRAAINGLQDRPKLFELEDIENGIHERERSGSSDARV